ncbi:MAG TPA: hypothetical protein VFS60_12355 [Thermoanaerobaculia bacterium]|nr:hypothetical protein [Thermoanaerobaculia bacterium]
MLTTTGLVVIIIAVAVVWFVVLWVAICFSIASVSGWRRLGLLYETGPFEGATFKFSGYVGRSRYRGALIAGATPTGLYLNVAAPFRIGAGPLLIPWHDITVSAPGAGSNSLVTFELPKARTRLRVPEDVASKLLEWQRAVT